MVGHAALDRGIEVRIPVPQPLLHPRGAFVSGPRTPPSHGGNTGSNPVCAATPFERICRFFACSAGAAKTPLKPACNPCATEMGDAQRHEAVVEQHSATLAPGCRTPPTPWRPVARRVLVVQTLGREDHPHDRKDARSLLGRRSRRAFCSAISRTTGMVRDAFGEATRPRRLLANAAVAQGDLLVEQARGRARPHGAARARTRRRESRSEEVSLASSVNGKPLAKAANSLACPMDHTRVSPGVRHCWQGPRMLKGGG